MKQILALAFAGALSAIVAACGGGGTRVEPPPVTHYAGVADVLESGCPYAVGAVVPGHTSASSAQSAALSRCTAEATRQAAGAARVRSCQATSIRQCVAIAAGIDNARDCQVSTRSASSLSSARSSALQACRSALGSGADCEVLASGCASSSSPSVGVWRPPPPPIINGRPETVGGIPSQTVEEGSSETVSVSSYFTDPDRDSLTYASRSSDTGIVAVSLSGNTVTLRGVSAGTATVRVTATDPDGASAYQDFAVEVVEAFGGVNLGQVGDEFGNSSTTGRTNLNLTCTDDVVFEDEGQVVLPSVDVVALPSQAGTVTLEYEAYQIPDRFVVQVGGRVEIDTQYVGTSRSVAQINAVLTRYGFMPTSQASIISPGRGTRTFQKAAGVTSAVVRVYAPLTGTEWKVTLKFSGSSCQRNGNGSGLNPGEVGNEFGTTPTTGRTNLNLTCTDDVAFSDSGNVVLPSVDVVALPSEAGTVTLEYEAFQVPDRFVVVMGGRTIDTQYVGTSRSVAEVNAVLNRYGFIPTSQASIISPGNGTRSLQKPAGVTSAVVRVYAPLTGTQWEVTLTFSNNSCPLGGGNGGGTPTNGAPQAAAAARTLSGGVGSSWTWTRAQLESAFRDPDGDQLTYTIGSSRPTVASSNVPSGGGMEINANSPGTAVISVTARDPGGLTATWRITVTVNQPQPQTPEIVFRTNDNCNDGRDVNMRFSYYRGTDLQSDFVNWATGVLAARGSDTVTRVSCNFSNVNRVCYGARIQGVDWYWGHDVDRSENCTNCCWTCTPSIGSRRETLNFNCPRQSVRIVCCVHRTLYARNQTPAGDPIRNVNRPVFPLT